MQPFDWSILRGTAEGRKRTLVSSLWAEAMLELLRVWRGWAKNIPANIMGVDMVGFNRHLCIYIYIVICKYIKTNVLIIHSKGIWKEIISAKIEKIGWQITMATLMQPLHYDFWCLAAKNNSFTHAAAPPSNLDAAITVRSAEIELQNTIECAQLQLQDRTSVPKQKNNFEAFFKK